MQPSERPEADPLDGYRGRSPDSDSLTDEILQFRQTLNDDVDLDAMREVIRSDELIQELKGESNTVRRLVDYATRQLDEACMVWQSDANPTSMASLNAHRNARAARLLLNWIQYTMEAGAQSERQLETEGNG